MSAVAPEVVVDWARPPEVPSDLVALWRSATWREHDRDVLMALREDVIDVAWEAIRSRTEAVTPRVVGTTGTADRGVSVVTGIAMGVLVAVGERVAGAGRRRPKRGKS